MQGYHFRGAVCAVALFALAHLASAEDNGGSTPSTVTLDIQVQPLSDALTQFGEQTGLQVVYYPELTAGLTAPRLVGSYTPQLALSELLANTSLEYQFINARTITIRSRAAAGNGSTALGTAAKSSATALRLADVRTSGSDSTVVRLADNGTQNSQDEEDSATADDKSKKKHGKKAEMVGTSEILVKDSRSLNTDIPRSRNDPQPYVIFDHETLVQSGATDLNDFFRKRLTMNTAGRTRAQSGGDAPNVSEINLRGLGSNQTLILIDGRRVADRVLQGDPAQPNINGIPLSAVERIEVLPTTSSGIFGGSATGGAINIVLRHDYQGIETQLAYGTFDSNSAATQRVGISSGFNLEGGKTQLLLNGSYSTSDMFFVGDRHFAREGRNRLLENNPSLLYYGNGSNIPPLGTGTNIVSLNGSPLFGPGTPNFTSVPKGYTGDGGTAALLAALQANAGNYNLEIPNSAESSRSQFGGTGTRVSLLPEETSKSIMTTLRRAFTPTLDVFFEGGLSRQNWETSRNSTIGPTFSIPATAPANPFGSAGIAIRVSVPLDVSSAANYASYTDTYRLVGGGVKHLPGLWSIGIDYSWSRSLYKNTSYNLPETTLTPAVRDGTVNVFRDFMGDFIDVSDYRDPPIALYSANTSTSKDAAVRASGPVLSLGTRKIMFSGLLEHRNDFFDEVNEHDWDFVSSYEHYIYPSRSQDIDSAYAEVVVPIVAPSNAVPGVQQLDLQLSGRYDRYSIHGVEGSVLAGTVPRRTSDNTHSWDPTIAIRYQPVSDLMLRASYGTGFLPPTVNQLLPSQPLSISVVDPKRGNETVTIDVISGGSPDLTPELSKSLSGGLVLTPRVIPGLRLSIDYTTIDKRNNISDFFSSFSFQQLIDAEDTYPDQIVRNPDPTTWGTYSVGPIQRMLQTLSNLNKAQVRAYDLQLDYQLEMSAVGTFDVYALATRQPHYKTQVRPIDPLVERVGVTLANPLKFKANAGVTWRQGAWTLDWSARYFHSYLGSTATQIQLAQGNGGRVPSQLYHDFFASYSFSGSWGSFPLQNTKASLNIYNVFNTSPPLDLAYSYLYSTLGDPRLRGANLSLTKSF